MEEQCIANYIRNSPSIYHLIDGSIVVMLFIRGYRVCQLRSIGLRIKHSKFLNVADSYIVLEKNNLHVYGRSKGRKVRLRDWLKAFLIYWNSREQLKQHFVILCVTVLIDELYVWCTTTKASGAMAFSYFPLNIPVSAQNGLIFKVLDFRYVLRVRLRTSSCSTGLYQHEGHFNMNF